MSDGLLSNIRFQAQALTLQAERGRVLASNIANADTPNYKARDFDFQKALAAATTSMPASGAAALMTTRSGHLTGTQGQAPGPAMLYRVPLQSAVDGNTVDLDTERAGFAENAVRYEASVRFLNGQIRQMLTAINGQ